MQLRGALEIAACFVRGCNVREQRVAPFARTAEQQRREQRMQDERPIFCLLDKGRVVGELAEVVADARIVERRAQIVGIWLWDCRAGKQRGARALIERT